MNISIQQASAKFVTSNVLGTFTNEVQFLNIEESPYSFTVFVKDIVLGAVVNADLVILLSDIDGLFTDDPHQNPDAEFIPFIP